MFYLLGYCIFTIICGFLSLSSAKKGNKNPWIPFIVGAVIRAEQKKHAGEQ